MPRDIKYHLIKICNPNNHNFWHNYFKIWFRIDLISDKYHGYNPFKLIQEIIDTIEKNGYGVKKYNVMNYGNE